MSRLNHIDYYIPAEELPIDTLLEKVPDAAIPKMFSDRDEYTMFVKGILNLESVRVEPTLNKGDMIGGLIEKMFERRVVEPTDIDIIIVAQETATDALSNLGHYLQFKHKMTHAHVMTISGNHCVNVEMALSVAAEMMKGNEQLKNILIVSATRTEDINRRLLGSFGVYGDAAGILLMGRKEEGPYLLDKEILCHGELYEVNMVKDNSITLCRLYLKCLKGLLNKRPTAGETVARVLIQNANPLLTNQCLASAGFNDNKIFKKNLAKYGHLNQVDFIVNLKDVLAEQAFTKDDQIMSFGSGWAGTYIASLFAF